MPLYRVCWVNRDRSDSKGYQSSAVVQSSSRHDAVAVLVKEHPEANLAAILSVDPVVVFEM